MKTGHKKIVLNVLRLCAFAFVTLSTSTVLSAPQDGGGINWPKSVKWVSFSEGQSLAASSQKPMMVLVYASWCKQCKALAKAMSSPEFVKASAAFVMVLTDHDDKTQGLTYYTPNLTYVPRIFFMQPNGELWVELQSGNTRYPYFYQPKNLSSLLTNMRTSLARHSEKR